MMVSVETNNSYGDSGAMDAAKANHAVPEQAYPQARPSRFTEFLLCFTGMTSAAIAAALIFAPGADPMLGKLANRLAGFGIEPSNVLMGGALVFAMGMLAHAFTRSASMVRVPTGTQEKDSDFMLVADQLATDMAQSLSTLLQISSEIAELSENNRTLLRNMPDPNGQATANQTPMFRLAASVDQLCAKVDTRLANLGLELNSSIQGVNASLSQVQGAMESQAAQVTQYAPVAEQAPMVATPESPMMMEQESLPAVHPADALHAAPSNPMDSMDLGAPAEEFSNPALDLFDKMDEHPNAEADPAAPFGTNQAMDPLDDLMPNHPNLPKPDLDI